MPSTTTSTNSSLLQRLAARRVIQIAKAAPLAKCRGRGDESGAMRSEIPPPGKATTFPEWSAAIVAGVRTYLPNARASRKGSRLVIIRHGELEARLVDDGGAFCISFRAGDAKTMSGLVDRDRRDAHTTLTLAHSIAGFFDAKFTRAENP
jgi:hypothetical protein